MGRTHLCVYERGERGGGCERGEGGRGRNGEREVIRGVKGRERGGGREEGREKGMYNSVFTHERVF